ncbi:MAG TPA: (2Fe-2S)-binding protein [Pseudonocardiaceae bacterium]|jgi:bacterioferritin-associated ferredoxin|nr:(2Fe-2S)-binding protein [Pseudonocardiaceae bacterium]
MYVCICWAVTEAQVHRCIAEGASTVEDVGDGCAAGTGCGSCHERIAALLGITTGDLWSDLPRSA